MRDGTEIAVRSKDDLILREGDVVTLASGGGGGWGQPVTGADTYSSRISDASRSADRSVGSP